MRRRSTADRHIDRHARTCRTTSCTPFPAKADGIREACAETCRKARASPILHFPFFIFSCLRRHGLNVFGGHLAHLAATGNSFASEKSPKAFRDFWLSGVDREKKTPPLSGRRLVQAGKNAAGAISLLTRFSETFSC